MTPEHSALVLLALPSLAALALLGRERRALVGGRAALAFFGALAAYGVLRGVAIRAVTGAALDTPFPYLMSQPVATLLGVSLQEVVGWSVAVTLALCVAERLAPGGGAHRVAAMAALTLAAICLAVENAAIRSRWWTWTLALPEQGAWRVPPVALLDWSFVAFDFLVPWLAFTGARAPWVRVCALALFPLHMLAHTWFRALPEPLPVAGYDLAHVGIVVYVLWQAVGESPRPPVPAARLRPLAAAAAALVVGSTAVACWASGQAAGALASLPLAVLAWFAFAQKPRVARAQVRPAAVRVGLRLGIVALALVFLAGVSAPQTRRQQRLLALLQHGAARANAGDLAGAETSLRAALEGRPDHAGARTLLALVLLRQGRAGEARAELDRALVAQPTARDALLIAATLDLQSGERRRAEQRLAVGRRVYPERPEFAYLALLARGEAGTGRPAAHEAVALARRLGPGALRDLAALAERFGDRATTAACRPAAPRLP